MCCCGCLLVDALLDAAMIEASRRAERAPETVAIAPLPVVSPQQAPQHLCGWIMLALRHRHRRPHDLRTLQS